MVFLTVGSVLAGPYVLKDYPIPALAQQSSISGELPTSALNEQADITNIDTMTNESEKPRRDVIEYTVEGGDTLSSIAKKFSNEKLGNTIDADSIAYLNNFSTSRVLKPGDTIKIPPVSGVVVTVRSGETIYSLAKKYGLASPQGIVDWTYNTFADDEKFTLTAGQTLVIPNGRPPEEAPAIPAPRKINTTPFAAGSGKFAWPTSGSITQYFTFYHTGVDIANDTGTPVYAADSGRVVTLSGGYGGGYGNHILVDHGNGFVTMYAHLSRFATSDGADVGRGQLIGYIGSTGRSTGPHLHFEVRKNGAFTNPLGFLK